MSLRCLVAVAWALPLSGFLIAPAPCDGCANVHRDKDQVNIAEESALIIWDAATKTQHFIRRATFATDAADFGFLVPTPTQPKLAEAKDEAFTKAESWTQAQRTTRFKFDPFICMIGCGLSSKMAMDKAGGVRILDAQRVAGQDAVVLEADDAGALAQWLKDHDYASSPELTSWLGPYIAQKWKITAFKFAHDPKTGNGVEPSAVRMSFTTEKPFFPYREPEEPKQKEPAKEKEKVGRHNDPRGLRVLFVGDQRMKGNVGGKSWPPEFGTAAFADKLTADERSELLKLTGLEETQIPSTAWLTMFEDPSSPRAGRDEVYFSPDAAQTPIHHPRNVREIWIPVDVAVLIGLLILPLLLMFLLRRPRKRPMVSP